MSNFQDDFSIGRRPRACQLTGHRSRASNAVRSPRCARRDDVPTGPADGKPLSKRTHYESLPTPLDRCNGYAYDAGSATATRRWRRSEIPCAPCCCPACCGCPRRLGTGCNSCHGTSTSRRGSPAISPWVDPADSAEWLAMIRRASCCSTSRGITPKRFRHVVQSVAVRTECVDGSSIEVAVLERVQRRAGPLPGVAPMLPARRQLIAPRVNCSVEPAMSGDLPVRFGRQSLPRSCGVACASLHDVWTTTR